MEKEKVVQIYQEAESEIKESSTSERLQELKMAHLKHVTN